MVAHDVAIVGGGCVGCSVAKHVAEGSDLDVCVVEKEYRLAAHQSGRNSGVLHPGYNYRPGSLKAEFAVEGTRRMKAYCREHGVPLDECGVLVCAQTEAEEQRLRELDRRAAENGVEARVIDRGELRDREPHAEGRAALHCPEAASVDSQQYVHQLARDAQNSGATFYLGHEVQEVEAGRDGGYRLTTDRSEIDASFLVNAAGLYADKLAAQVGVGEGYRVVPFRGEYYELSPDRADLCRSMLYPAPDPELPFLGVHFTRRSDGKVIVGPNAVLAFGREAYRNTDLSPKELAGTLGFGGFWKLMASTRMLRAAAGELGKSYRKKRFVASAQELVPDVRGADLTRSYAGIRAQVVSADGELVQDPLFVNDENAVHVLNAVSPGLTCSLPMGEHLADVAIGSF